MSAPVRKTVELFYDVVSPYAWIGFEMMNRYKTKWNIDLQLKPFFLGGVMQATGNQAPIMVQAKARYLHVDLGRLAEYYKIPIKLPANPAEVLFEKGTLKPMRFVTAVDTKNKNQTEEISRQLWLRVWNQDKDITEKESMIEAGKAAGLSDADIKDALERMGTKEVKDRLKEYTQQAIDYGAFGAPTFVAHVNGKKEMVFGSDRINIVAHLLGEKFEGPLTELSKL